MVEEGEQLPLLACPCFPLDLELRQHTDASNCGTGGTQENCGEGSEHDKTLTGFCPDSSWKRKRKSSCGHRGVYGTNTTLAHCSGGEAVSKGWRLPQHSPLCLQPPPLLSGVRQDIRKVCAEGGSWHLRYGGGGDRGYLGEGKMWWKRN